MKYRLFSGVLALAFLLTLFTAASPAQAQAHTHPRIQAHTHPRIHAVPNTSSVCRVVCEAYVSWNGSSTNHGNGSTFTIDNPGGSGFQWYEKGVEESNANGYDIFLGLDKNDFCTGLSFFFIVSLNNNPLSSPDCTPVPNGDINKLALFQLSYYVSGGGGIFYTVSGYTGSIWNHKAYACSGCTQAFNFVGNDFIIADSSFSGHTVWGGAWVENQYFDGAWHYDTTAQMNPVKLSNDNGNGPPPQMYWESLPNGSQNDGGDLWSCLYDSTTNQCNLGS